MTVIVVRGGVMAADTGVWQGQVAVGHTKKIHRLHDGRLYAASGDRPLTIACRQWLNGEMERPAAVPDGEFGGLILGHERIERIDHRFLIYESSWHEFHVEGSHVQMLIGALAAGASAEQAVRIAIAYGDSAAGEVQVERL